MRIYTLLLLLICSATAISQNCNNTLSGKVIDLHDGTILVGATLIVAGTEQMVITDLEGNFTIPNLCNLSYNIQISHPYCLTKVLNIKIDGDTSKTIYLEHHIEELNEIIVKGLSITKKLNTIIEKNISQEDLERYSSGSLGDAINSLSGVSSLNTGNTVVKPMINGLHSSRVIVINNGVQMEDQEWGSEHAPNLDINAIGSISVIKGAGALQYSGDAIGGVIVAEAAKVPVKDSLFGKTLMTVATNGRGGSLSSQLTKSYENGWYGTAQATLKRFGDFETPDYVLSNTGIYETNASFRVGFNQFKYGFEALYSVFKNDIGILRASHLGGAEDQFRAINSDRPLIINDFTYDLNEPRQEVTHHLARLKAFKRFNGLGKLSLQYDFQQNNRLEFDVRRGDNSGEASLDLALSTHTLMLDLDSKLSETTDLKTGIVARYQDNFANPETDVRRLIPDYDKYDLGAYAIVDHRLNDKWLLEAGARFDYTFIDALKFYRTSFWESRNYDQLFPELVIETSGNQVLTNPELRFNNSSATVGANYFMDEDYTLSFNYSLASRAPNPSELFSEGLHHSASRIELGDLRFVSEVAHKFVVNFQREHEVFSFSVNPYVNTINNFMLIEPTGIQQTVRGNFQVWEYRQTNARLLGVDIDALYQFSKNIHYKHQFSLVKGYDLTRNLALINMPSANTQNEIVYQNSELNNVRLSIQSDFVFRQNEFPDNNFEVFIPETQTTELIDVSTPPDAYHLLNFNSSMDFKMNEKSSLTLGFAMTNITNTRYRNYLNRLRYYADDLGRNFLLNIKINY
ncbi:TonB-dependent receptor domain-containing protein [Cellulophaga sp. Hel_I_12]|uniref:TonB-dependent receptor n=1 Tax=Cellulophaga sp. Hel_I_12 TaxID=1249972 RepID=UPI0006455732|nr:TonB-dependent receptor [Cellulophaga sp. Hel_I_12]